MTDISNGKIEFFNYEVNKDTTLDEFEKALGNRVYKEVNPINTNIVTFTINGDIGIYDFDIKKFKPFFSISGMNFVNAKITFFDNTISYIELVPDLISFDVDDNGKNKPSWEKSVYCFNSTKNWLKKILGTPNKDGEQQILFYGYSWGIIQNTRIDSPPQIIIEYNRNNYNKNN